MDQLLANLHADLDRANGTDLTTVGDDTVRAGLAELEAIRAKVDALTCALTTRAEARQLPAVDEAITTRAWLTCRPDLHLPSERASAQVRLARKLATLPHTAQALRAGRINLEVVRKLASVDNPRTHDALRRDEADLVEVAATQRFDRFCTHVDCWRLLNDPDGARPRSEQRRLHMDETFEGFWAMAGWFDPLTGKIIHNELIRLDKMLFDADWAEARRRVGRDPETHELRRTPAQRRADALRLMAERSRCTNGPNRPAPLLTIVAGSDAFAGVLRTLDGTVLSPEEVAVELDEAVIERITFDGDDKPFAISKQRCFRGALRRAILIRDQECTHPMCDVPASRCQVDHVIPDSAGGTTSIDNGQGHCGPHNRARNNHPPDDDPD